MRRVFVIFLILLFPLSAFALSMSVSQLHQGQSMEQTQSPAPLADLGLTGAFDCDASCDIDPDEPPSGAELHYIVDQEKPLLAAGQPARAPVLHDADPDCHSIPPPVKPPRAA
jgi:hypothetical protein